MGKLSKFFRAFVEGQTISDGRTITAEMIDEVVATFNRETYSPRINVEHIKGFSPEPPFNGYGDVVAVKAQDDEFTIAGKAETRRALYAQVEGNDQLVQLADSDQKPYPSVELTPDYAGTGKVGLVGLAFTDSPASIGTEKLKFSRSAPGTVFSAGADPVAIEFDKAAPDSQGIADAIKAGFANFASMFKPADSEKQKEPETPKKPANDNFDAGAFATQLGEVMATTVAAAIKPVVDAHATLAKDVGELKSQLEQTEASAFSRHRATGAQVDAKFATDC